MNESKKGPVNPAIPIIVGVGGAAFVFSIVAQAIDGGTSTTLYCVIGGVAFIGVAANRHLRRRQATRFMREGMQASEALARGDFAAARVGLSPWAAQLWMP